jgi:hypothetical protein
MLKVAFNRLADAWFAVCCNPDKPGFARFVDSFKSNCTYCTAARAMCLGAAIPGAAVHWGLSVTLVVTVYALKWGEDRYGTD